MQFPVILECPPTGGSLQQWLRDNTEYVDMLLATTGAVLLRGFQVRDAGDFHDAATHLLGRLMHYIEGASPRRSLGGGLYTSTEYAPDQTVALHNELSYSSRWPGRVAFFCETPAERGGQTPIADSRKVYERIVRSDSGPLPTTVRYVRHMHAGKGAGVGWPTVFDTRDAAQVEAHCRTAAIDVTWLANQMLRTTQVRPAAIVHPRTGERIWFNQAHQWHPSNGGTEAEALWRELFGDELPMNAVQDNGEEIGKGVLETIRAAYEAERVMVNWQAGDVMVLDNMLTAHGRAPFTGSRQVLVAMGRPVRLSDVENVTSHD